jgi:trimethylamine--corrinoid protein Co-methyltransferase
MAREEGRRGGRVSRRKLRTAKPIVVIPALVREIPVYEVLSKEGEELIHDASMKILEEVGIDFRDTEAIELWRGAGAEIDGERVRIPRELLMAELAKAPETITMHGRNPARTVDVGGRSMIFVPTYGSPFVLDFDGERRYGTLEDLNNFHKLAYMAPYMHNTGGIICEPVDIPVSKRHLHIAYSMLRYSDKPFMGATTAPERAEDTVEMAKIVYGDAFIEANTVMASVINCNSPLVWDATMLGALKCYARHNQASLVSPFVLAGANTPASTVGALAQLNAEALAGIAFAQVVRPGAPAIYGQFLAAVSMKSGAPMAGTPELGHLNFMVGQLARRYRLPWRSSGMVAGSKVMDAQAAYESINSMYAILLAGANFVLHTAGWLEAGLTASYAKFMLDAEQMAMFFKLARGVDLTDLEPAMATVREVGPGGHFFGTKHTQDNFQSAFFIPELFDNNSYEQWVAEGSTDATTRAMRAAKDALERYEAPPLDEAIDEALKDFIRRREAELPDAFM